MKMIPYLKLARLNRPHLMRQIAIESAAEVREDDFAACDFDPGLAFEFFENVLKRQAVEAVAAHTGVREAARDGQSGGGWWQVPVEGGVEACDLRHAGQAAGERVDQSQRPGQVVRGERHRGIQVGEQVGRDELRVEVHRPAVDDAVPDSGDPGEFACRVQEIEQPGDRPLGVGRGQRPPLVRPAGSADTQECVGLAQALDSPSEPPHGRLPGFEDCELDARRAAVQRENAVPGWCGAGRPGEREDRQVLLHGIISGPDARVGGKFESCNLVASEDTLVEPRPEDGAVALLLYGPVSNTRRTIIRNFGGLDRASECHRRNGAQCDWNGFRQRWPIVACYRRCESGDHRFACDSQCFACRHPSEKTY